MKPRTRPLLLTDSMLGNLTEGDCACSSSPVPNFSADSLILSELIISSGVIKQKLDDDFQVFLSPKSGSGVSILNNAAIEMLNNFDLQIQQDDVVDGSELTELAAQFFSQGLLELPKGKQTTRYLPRTDTLTAWLHLTDRCNFRCSYCYLPHVREDMSIAIGYAAIDAVLRSAVLHKFKRIKIKYAGGEPLLRYSLILELHAHAKKLADEHGLILEEMVLSNGSLLTSEIANVLKSLNIHLMLSLDGLGNYHDTHRPYAGGRGSFEDVSSAVDLALANGLVPNISVTVNGKTIEGLPSLLVWILERNLPFNLNFYRENEISASRTDLKLDEQEIIKGMLAAFDVIESNLPERSILSGIVDRANMAAVHTHTCGVGENYLVFDQHGQIAKCQMHILNPITNIAVHDPLTVLQSDKEDIQNLPVEEKEGCKTCEWRHWCTGGCPLTTHWVTGRYDVKSPNCNIYKTLFPEVLRLEGLRILKYSEKLLI